MEDIIDGTTLSLNEWLDILFTDKAARLSPNCCFPTDKMRDEYLATIHERSEDEIKKLLRRFLVRSGYLGAKWYLAMDNIFREKKEIPIRLKIDV